MKKFLLLFLLFSTDCFEQEMDLPTLRKGVNLSHWLQHWGRQPVNLAELKTLKKIGFDHVRLPFDPARYGWDSSTQDLKNFQIEELSDSISMILEADLAVILDMHPGENIATQIEIKETAQQSFVALWGTIAAKFSKIPTSSLAFELLNEPQYYKTSSESYRRLMQSVLNEVRKYAPKHMVLIDGIHGGNIEGLQALEGLTSERLGYVFHYYEPLFFTHLNAPWEPFSKNVNGMVSGLAYPAYLTVLSGLQIFPEANVFTVTQAVRHYIDESWDSPRIQQEISVAKTWARKHGSRLVCTEFGALRIGVREESWARWLKDVRISLEKSGIGWTVWDYGDAFGIAQSIDAVTIEKDGARVPRESPHTPRVFLKSALSALDLRE
ncbi:Cellulase domain-containing protein [Gammaproteobacteria bacterium]